MSSAMLLHIKVLHIFPMIFQKIQNALIEFRVIFSLNKMKICECVNVLGQNSFDHVNAIFLAPIKCNPSWCTTRVATKIIKIYKVTHKTTSVYLFINKSILLLLLLFSIFLVLKVW